MRSAAFPIITCFCLLVTACAEPATAPPDVDAPAFGKGTYAKGRIAFHSFRNGEGDIYTMNADGTGLTNPPGRATESSSRSSPIAMAMATSTP